MIDSSTTAASVDGTAGEVARPLYWIDPDWYEAQGLSLQDVARQRMCDQCARRMGEPETQRVPVFDKETGRMKIEERQGTYGSDPIRVIKEHCGRSKGFIHRDMPTLEAVFRVLLANGDTPMTLEDVRDQLAEWCPGGGCQWLLLPIEQFQRLIDHDNAYGLARAEAEQSASA